MILARNVIKMEKGKKKHSEQKLLLSFNPGTNYIFLLIFCVFFFFLLVVVAVIG